MERINYTEALEVRMRWLKWVKTGALEHFKTEGRDTLPIYRVSLEKGETFFMNSRFCQLVDNARRTIPDELEYDPKWLNTKSGWMWLEEPFEVPEFSEEDEFKKQYDAREVSKYKQFCRIAAVGWYEIPNLSGQVPPGTTEVIFFMDRGHAVTPQNGFSMWAYMALLPGTKVLDRIHTFEKTVTEQNGYGMYKQGRDTDMLHEIRWFYTAMHLMSQKLATTFEHKAERATRKRMVREGSKLPQELKVVTLRRMMEDQKKDPSGHTVDWQWQWRVEGFWRNQWYPLDQCHRRIFIEEYIKGPKEKPIKPVGKVLYRVGR